MLKFFDADLVSGIRNLLTRDPDGKIRIRNTVRKSRRISRYTGTLTILVCSVSEPDPDWTGRPKLSSPSPKRKRKKFHV